jgi:Domain of unknown function (DUF4145)
MCRRAMQQIASDKGAEGSRLIDQIDDLHAKGLITKSLHDAAHEIRHFGNSERIPGMTDSMILRERTPLLFSA